MKTRLPTSLLRLVTGMFGSLAFFTLAVSVAHAADPVRLTEIPIHRYVLDEVGRTWRQTGHLASSGLMTLTTETRIEDPVQLPLAIVERPLVVQASWHELYDGNPESVANFTADTDVSIRILSESYYRVEVAPIVPPPAGDLINISTRAYVMPDREPVIAGFVVSDHRRRVLIRGVGPALGAFGVGEALADPSIAVYRWGVSGPIATSDNWDQVTVPDLIQDAAELVGAFALPRGSLDAALVVDLEPGVYTVHLTAKSATGGTALVEVYAVP